MSRLLAALALGAAFTGACKESPAGPTDPEVAPSLARSRPFRPGERQPLVDLKANTLAIWPELVAQNLSQTFTPRTNQVLGYLKLPVGCAVGVLLNVKIRDGLGGAILYESNHSGLPTVVDGTFSLLQVFDPAVSRGIKLRRGHTYAFELASFPSPGASETTCGLVQGPAGDTYRRGQGFYRDPINGPAWLPLPDGAPTSNTDLPFITLVHRR